MSNVEKSYKPRLKTILKQHHFNVNRAQMNKYSCTQILISVHMDRFAYMKNLRICKLKFALGLKQVQISRICIWCKFFIRVQTHSHGQICTREYICECTLSRPRNSDRRYLTEILLLRRKTPTQTNKTKVSS